MFDLSSEDNDLSLSVIESPSKVLMHSPQVLGNGRAPRLSLGILRPRKKAEGEKS